MRDPVSTGRTLRNFLLVIAGLLMVAGVCGIGLALTGQQGWLIAALAFLGLAGIVAMILLIAIPARISFWGWESFGPNAQRGVVTSAVVIWLLSMGVAGWGIVQANRTISIPEEPTLPLTEPVLAGVEKPSNVVRVIGSTNGRVGRHTTAVA